MRELERLDCIELVETRPVRGATEHFYRATARAFFSADEWVQLPETIRTSISGMMITEMWGFVGEAMTAGTFDARDDRDPSWQSLRSSTTRAGTNCTWASSTALWRK